MCVEASTIREVLIGREDEDESTHTPLEETRVRYGHNLQASAGGLNNGCPYEESGKRGLSAAHSTQPDMMKSDRLQTPSLSTVTESRT